mmetsp:Transcript_12877/g.16876  ORF Transcript_12877/g.16876 Transcript_12877/m.16876 type:complete len:89 (+) Transcript_12877:293-559(+)
MRPQNQFRRYGDNDAPLVGSSSPRFCGLNWLPVPSGDDVGRSEGVSDGEPLLEDIVGDRVGALEDVGDVEAEGDGVTPKQQASNRSSF